MQGVWIIFVIITVSKVILWVKKWAITPILQGLSRKLPPVALFAMSIKYWWPATIILSRRFVRPVLFAKHICLPSNSTEIRILLRLQKSTTISVFPTGACPSALENVVNEDRVHHPLSSLYFLPWLVYCKSTKTKNCQKKSIHRYRYFCYVKTAVRRSSSRKECGKWRSLLASLVLSTAIHISHFCH